MKRPSLTEIYEAVLDHYGFSREEWERVRSSREAKVVVVRRTVAHIAAGYWYKNAEIAAELCVHRATVEHHVRTSQGFADSYRGYRQAINDIREKIAGKGKVVLDGWLARTHHGVLIISQVEPERAGGFWFAEGSRIFAPQSSFPDISWETGPKKIKITIELDEDGNNSGRENQGVGGECR